MMYTDCCYILTVRTHHIPLVHLLAYIFVKNVPFKQYQNCKLFRHDAVYRVNQTSIS